jgi:hypothetical protein
LQSSTKRNKNVETNQTKKERGRDRRKKKGDIKRYKAKSWIITKK